LSFHIGFVLRPLKNPLQLADQRDVIRASH
jgi:hypothetical protein